MLTIDRMTQTGHWDDEFFVYGEERFDSADFVIVDRLVEFGLIEARNRENLGILRGAKIINAITQN